MNFFRRHLESKLTKAIALIMALIFVGWEFTSSMLKESNTWVIKVGEVEYRAKDWQETYKQLTQDPLSAQEAMLNPQYAKKRVLDEMIRNALILQEASDIGLRVNDKMAASEIIHMKIFQNEEKKFDKNKLEEVLRMHNISEGDFIKKMKDNILRNQLMDVFYNTSNIIGNPTFNLLLKLVTAGQDITLYKVPLLKTNIEPSEDILRKFMDDNKAKFMTEDEADISKIIFTSDLIEKIEITEEDIKNYYDTHALIEPEKRTVNQIVIPSHNEAKKILEDIKSGKTTYEEVANFYIQKQMIPYEIGPFTSEGFDEDIAKIVFKLQLNEISELVQTPLGWHIFRVNKIYEAKAKDLNLMREDIALKLSKQRTIEKMNNLAEQVMTEINSKLTLLEIAAKHNLEVKNFKEKAIRLPNGMIDIFSIPEDLLENGIAKKRIISAAFVNDNEIKLLTSKDNQSFILIKTNDLIPGHLMQFEDVKKQLVEDYRSYQSDQATKQLAKEYRTNILAKKDGEKPENTKLKLSRISRNDQIPDCIQKLIAEMNRNGIFDGLTMVCQENENYFFAELNAIDFSVEVSEEEQASLRQPILSIYNEMIFNQFLMKLRNKYKVKLDEQFAKYLNE